MLLIESLKLAHPPLRIPHKPALPPSRQRKAEPRHPVPRMRKGPDHIPHAAIGPFLDAEHLLTALRMLRQRAVNKTMRRRRVTAAQNATRIHPPQAADARYHRHDVSRLLISSLLDFAAEGQRGRGRRVWNQLPSLRPLLLCPSAANRAFLRHQPRHLRPRGKHHPHIQRLAGFPPHLRALSQSHRILVRDESIAQRQRVAQWRIPPRLQQATQALGGWFFHAEHRALWSAAESSAKSECIFR